jgi:hypothetical protein
MELFVGIVIGDKMDIAQNGYFQFITSSRASFLNARRLRLRITTQSRRNSVEILRGLSHIAFFGFVRKKVYRRMSFVPNSLNGLFSS